MCFRISCKSFSVVYNIFASHTSHQPMKPQTATRFKCRKLRHWQWFCDWIEDPEHRRLPLPLPSSSSLPDHTKSSRNARRYFLGDVNRWAKQLFASEVPFEIIDTNVGMGLRRKASTSNLRSSLRGERVLLTKSEARRC